MENFGTRKRHYSWISRRKAEGMSISEFAACLNIDEKLYMEAERGLHSNCHSDVYTKITRAIMERNHSFGKSIRYYKIRLRQAVYELAYVETEEELKTIQDHMRIHKRRMQKLQKELESTKK